MSDIYNVQMVTLAQAWLWVLETLKITFSE